MSQSISPEPFDARSPPVSRPRAVTAQSHTSNRSWRSNGSKNKMDLTETSKEKRHLDTKADPLKALSEATPAEQAQEAATVDDLRKMAHKDVEGNVITDPDRSNPTRHRLERPLDTIRAFNAAAEGTSTRRTSYHSRANSSVGGFNDANRRTSYYSNNGISPQRGPPRATPGGGHYHRNNSYGFGPGAYGDDAQGAPQMYGRNGRQPMNPYHGPQNGYTGYQNGQRDGFQNPYPTGESPMSAHSYQHSYDNMTSGSEDYNKSTNPSSQNSSFDQLHQLRRPDDYSSENPYANEIKFGHVHSQQPFPQYDAGGHEQSASQAPHPPRKDFAATQPRPPPKFNSTPPNALYNSPNAGNAPPAARKSWIKRTFSRRDK